VLVSLFTDKRATEDYAPPPGDPDLRGWWADAYTADPIGSNIWQLERHTKTSDTLNLAISYARQSLQWLIADGVASKVDVIAEWQGDGALVLAMQVTITEPSGSISRFKYSWAWGAI
jgi:phage gp46-like protein